MGICCMAQETQIGALYQPREVGWGGRWEGVSRGRGYVHIERLHFHFSLLCIGEGNGLENPRDGGAWWAAVYGVAQSRTRLRRLSSSSMADSC